MLTRAIRPSLAALSPAAGAAPTAARNMATLREIELRLKSVRNIEKITKSMKMIASTKLARAQRAMQAAKSYGIANTAVFEHSEAAQADVEGHKKKLFIVVSSDRGLCGGIHSSVSKATRRELSHSDEGSKVIILGDKSKAQLTRAVPNSIALTFNQIGKDIPTFGDASAIADEIVKSGLEYDSVALVYNKFVSAISYEAAVVEVFSEEALEKAPNFRVYEQEDENTRDLSEFALANAIFAALVEGHAAEQSSRRNAMDNASKNANDMISSLQMQYNRGRQASITNELVDIITGASAL